MFLPPKKKNEFGHITLSYTGIDLAKKNKFFALGFGVLGALLTPAKDFHSILWDEILSIEIKKYGITKKACYVTLKDGSEYIFKMATPDKNIPLLQEEFRKSKNVQTKNKSMFLD